MITNYQLQSDKKWNWILGCPWGTNQVSTAMIKGFIVSSQYFLATIENRILDSCNALSELETSAENKYKDSRSGNLSWYCTIPLFLTQFFFLFKLKYPIILNLQIELQLTFWYCSTWIAHWSRLKTASKWKYRCI